MIKPVNSKGHYLQYRILKYLQQNKEPVWLSVISPDLRGYFDSDEIFHKSLLMLSKGKYIEMSDEDNFLITLTEKGRNANAYDVFLKDVIKDNHINQVLLVLADYSYSYNVIDETNIFDEDKQLKKSEIYNAYDVLADSFPQMIYIDDMEGNYYKLLCLNQGYLTDLVEIIENGGVDTGDSSKEQKIAKTSNALNKILTLLIGIATVWVAVLQYRASISDTQHDQEVSSLQLKLSQSDTTVLLLQGRIDSLENILTERSTSTK